MKNIHQKLFVILTVVLLSMPMTYLIGVKDPTVLNGVEPKTDIPNLQEKSWKKRDFQQDFEKWWNTHFGFRKLALKTKNTLYDLANFNRMHAGYSKTLIETENRNLIRRGVIRSLFDLPCFQKKEIVSPKIRKLVKTLQADDRQVLFVLGTTKADVYENDIPKRFKFFAHKKCDIYRFWEDLLDEIDVPYLNTVPMMKEMAKKEGYEPYSRTGTHWAAYAAFRVTQEILKKLELGNLSIKEIKTDDTPPQGERDIANLINTFIPYLPDEKFEHVSATLDKKIDKKFVSIGDSYTGSFIHTTIRNKIISGNNMLQISNRPILETEVLTFFNNKDIYLFINQGINWNDPYASMFKNIDTILKNMPTHFMHDWLKNDKGVFVSTDKSSIIIPNVDEEDMKLKLSVSETGGSVFINGMEKVIDKKDFETILSGSDTDDKFRFVLTFKSEKPIELSKITVQSLASKAKLPLSVRFSDKTLPFETSGLSFAESWGRWSDGDSVKFRFDLPKNTPLKFIFKDTHAFVPQENPMVTATVFANGKQVAQWIFEYNIVYPKTEFTVPMDILKIKRPLEIEIKIDGANSPASLGTGQDERRLGIGFHSLTITP